MQEKCYLINWKNVILKIIFITWCVLQASASWLLEGHRLSYSARRGFSASLSKSPAYYQAILAAFMDAGRHHMLFSECVTHRNQFAHQITNGLHVSFR